MKVIFISGPYMGQSKFHDHRGYFEIDANIGAAAEAFRKFAEAGVGAFCPHTHSAHFEVIAPNVPPSYWYALDLEMLRYCDAIYMLPGWRKSSGAKLELVEAERIGLMVFYDVQKAVQWAKNEEALDA